MTTTDQPWRRPVIEVLYVQDCPHYQQTLALVDRVRGDLGIDAELRTTLIADQAAAQQARFGARQPCGWTAVTSSPAADQPADMSLVVGCTGSSTASPASRRSAGCVRRCCARPTTVERSIRHGAD